MSEPVESCREVLISVHKYLVACFNPTRCSHRCGLGSGKIHYILRAPTLVLGLSIIGIDREGRGSLAIGFLDKVRLPSEASIFIADCLIFGWISLMHQYILGLVANI